MSLIDACHDFMKEVAAPSIGSSSFSRRNRFVILDHSADNEEFILKIYNYRDQFEHLIDQYVNEMLAELKNNKKLYDAGWDVHNIIIDRFEVACGGYFNDAVYLIVKTF